MIPEMNGRWEVPEAGNRNWRYRALGRGDMGGRNGARSLCSDRKARRGMDGDHEVKCSRSQTTISCGAHRIGK